MPVETMVLVEARVLCGDDSVLEIGRDLTKGCEFVEFVIWRLLAQSNDPTRLTTT